MEREVGKIDVEIEDLITIGIYKEEDKVLE
jgi:hypothetical protein